MCRKMRAVRICLKHRLLELGARAHRVCAAHCRQRRRRRVGICTREHVRVRAGGDGQWRQRRVQRRRPLRICICRKGTSCMCHCSRRAVVILERRVHRTLLRIRTVRWRRGGGGGPKCASRGLNARGHRSRCIRRGGDGGDRRNHRRLSACCGGRNRTGLLHNAVRRRWRRLALRRERFFGPKML